MRHSVEPPRTLQGGHQIAWSFLKAKLDIFIAPRLCREQHRILATSRSEPISDLADNSGLRR